MYDRKKQCASQGIGNFLTLVKMWRKDLKLWSEIA